MCTPTNPPIDLSFCTLEIPVFTLCPASNLFLPHPPTAKISTNVTSSKAFLVPIVTLITTLCLSVSGINKAMHPCHASLNVCNSRGKKKKKKQCLLSTFSKIGLFAGWSVLPQISIQLNLQIISKQLPDIRSFKLTAVVMKTKNQVTNLIRRRWLWKLRLQKLVLMDEKDKRTLCPLT